MRQKHADFYAQNMAVNNLDGKHAECSDFSEVDQGEPVMSDTLREDMDTCEPLQNLSEPLVGLNDDTAMNHVASFTPK